MSVPFFYNFFNQVRTELNCLHFKVKVIHKFICDGTFFFFFRAVIFTVKKAGFTNALLSLSPK